MESILFIILGIVFILVGIIFISKQSKEEKEIYKDILVKYNDIKDYTNTMDQIIDNMDVLIDNVLEKYNVLEEKIQEQSKNIHLRNRDNPDTYQSVDQRAEERPQQRVHQSDVIEEETVQYSPPIQEKVKEEKPVEKTLKERISEMKDEGLSNQEIAKKLGKGIREIEIITKMINIKKSNNFS